MKHPSNDCLTLKKLGEMGFGGLSQARQLQIRRESESCTHCSKALKDYDRSCAAQRHDSTVETEHVCITPDDLASLDLGNDEATRRISERMGNCPRCRDISDGHFAGARGSSHPTRDQAL